MKRLVWVLLAGTATISLHAQTAPNTSKTYAQALIDREVARHPELVELEMHVTPPGSANNVVIASKSGKTGEKSDADDSKVIKTGNPYSEVTDKGSHYEVELPLQDASARTLGALSVVFPYKAGADTHALETTAQTVRNDLARRISHVKNLLEPAQTDTRVPLDSYAQKLVDDALDKHPDIIIMAMHATIPNTHDNVIIASNIGRIGKKADEDDMRVVNTGKPNLEVNETGDRFEAELVLENAAHENIGAIGIVYAYKAGEDKKALQHKAEQVRDELAGQIPSAARLVESVKPAAAADNAAAPLKLLGRTELPQYSGDFDHAGGEGYIGVIQQKDADHYVELAHIASAKGAKTAILVPSLHRLYVAVSPGEGQTGAAVLWFDVLPSV